MASKEPEISVKKIMQKIEEEVEKRRTDPGKTSSECSKKTEIRNPEGAPFTGDSPPARRSDMGVIKGTLWKYGTKYAAVIKKIPIARSFAEKYYWKLSGIKGSSFNTNSSFHAAINSGVDIESNLNYIGFLSQIRHEGLKGKIKRLIFNIIGFFAWWQAQVNKALYAKIARHEAQLVQLTAEISNQDARLVHQTEQIKNHEAQVAQQTAQIANQEARLLHQSEQIKNHEAQVARQAERINNQQKQLADRDKTIEDLVYKLSVLSRIEDSLYKELTNQKAEIARLRREIAEHTCQQKDS